MLLAAAIGGCASKPMPPAATPLAPYQAVTTRPAPPVLELERQYAELDDGISVDYQIQRKVSATNKVSCYAFITGTLINASNQTLSRKTVLDFNFFSAGKQVFRDLTSPVSDVPPGTRVQLAMLVSPVHKDGCIRYDPIVVLLRKVLVK